VLTWGASVVANSGTVTLYEVYENGKPFASTTNTSFIVTGLTPNTSYSFTVAANDSLGESAQSGSVPVSTEAAGTGSVVKPVFAPYIDMSMAQDQDLAAVMAASGVKTFTLAFVLSSGPGQIGWGGVGTIANDGLPGGSSMLAQIQAVQQAGGNIIISFGGANGTEPALVASSAAQLQAEYQSVITRYGVNSLDFDIEGGAVADAASLHLRDQALVGLEKANPGLTLSFTLPVLPNRLDPNGQAILQDFKADGLNPDVINIMAMDYGPNADNGAQMGVDAISAALSTIDQIKFAGLTSKVGITPMIGVNDDSAEVFSLSDAQALAAFADGTPQVARLAMWSMARDNGSGAGHAWASPTDSGIAQSDYQISSIFK
jgi:hypothetical protein